MPGNPVHRLQAPKGSRIAGSPYWVLLIVFALAAALAGGAQQAAPAKPAATTVGSDTCQACHEDIFKAFQTSPHAAVEKDARRGWQGKACESCHGAGSRHAESTDKKDILNPATATAGQADKACLTCHFSSPAQAGRLHGGHARGQVSCASCHKVHGASGTLVPTRAAAVNKSCAQCHQQEWAAFLKPHAHRLPQGAMACTDCHNPHGTLLPRSLSAVSANEQACVKCHGDKRGPFAYEHAPMRLEGCQACHEPHGSANPRMLTRHEVRFVCLECHAAKPAPSVETLPPALGGVPPSFHDLQNPRYRNCTVCHVKIHGSHVSRSLLR